MDNCFESSDELTGKFTLGKQKTRTPTDKTHISTTAKFVEMLVEDFRRSEKEHSEELYGRKKEEWKEKAGEQEEEEKNCAAW